MTTLRSVHLPWPVLACFFIHCTFISFPCEDGIDAWGWVAPPSLPGEFQHPEGCSERLNLDWSYTLGNSPGREGRREGCVIHPQSLHCKPLVSTFKGYLDGPPSKEKCCKQWKCTFLHAECYPCFVSQETLPANVPLSFSF